MVSEIIDGFSHILPRPFFREMEAVNPSEELRRYEDSSFDMLWETSVDDRVAAMDANGIDRQVITLAQPALWRGIDPADALELTRIANDELSEIADDYPDRLIPVATLPRLERAFVDELDRCLDDLGMVGVQIFSNVDGEPLDAEAFTPFFSEVDRRGVPIWIHPQLHPWHDWVDEYMLHKAFGWPFDTSLALGRLVYSGIMERYDLDIIAHHMGGMIPQFSHRAKPFDEIQSMYLDDQPTLSRAPADYFTDFYGDTSLRGAPAPLKHGLGYFGPEHVVFAIDFPFGPDSGRKWMKESIASIENLDITEQDRAAILGGNLRTLISG